MKIYVASSWRNEFQPSVVKILRKIGHEVYDFRNPRGKTGFSWSKIDEDWENWTTEQYKEALKHPIAQAGFNSDFDAMKWADCCVMVLPCGRSANTEAGWMKGAGKKVFVYQPIKQEPELMYKIYDGIISLKEGLYDYFGSTKNITNDNHPKLHYSNIPRFAEKEVTPKTIREVRDFLNSIPEEFIDRTFSLQQENDVHCIHYLETAEEDMYYDEDCPEEGSMILSECLEYIPDTDIVKLKIGIPKGAPIIVEDF